MARMNCRWQTFSVYSHAHNWLNKANIIFNTGMARDFWGISQGVRRHLAVSPVRMYDLLSPNSVSKVARLLKVNVSIRESAVSSMSLARGTESSCFSIDRL
jgi:hypothetical protein